MTQSEKEPKELKQKRTDEREKRLRDQFFKIRFGLKNLGTAYRQAIQEKDFVFAEETKIVIFKLCADFVIEVYHKGYLSYYDMEHRTYEVFSDYLRDLIFQVLNINDAVFSTELLAYIQTQCKAATPYNTIIWNPLFVTKIYSN